MKIFIVGTELLHAGGPTERRTDMTKLIVASRSFANACRGVYVFCVDLRTNSDYFPIQH